MPIGGGEQAVLVGIAVGAGEGSCGWKYGTTDGRSAAQRYLRVSGLVRVRLKASSCRRWYAARAASFDLSNFHSGPSCFAPAAATPYQLSDFLYPEVGPENGTAAGCGYSNLTYCPDYCSVGIDGLHPASDYDFECWSLSVPSERVNGTGRTATPPLACGGFLCVALDSTGAVLTEWNVTATRFLPVPSGMPMRTVDTNGRTSCGVIAADVRVDVVMTNHHVECVGVQAMGQRDQVVS